MDGFPAGWGDCSSGQGTEPVWALEPVGEHNGVHPNSPSGKIALSADVNNFAVLLSVSSQYPQNYIYRDGKLIGKAVKREESETSFFYVDYTALGSHTYYAMGVDDQSNYQQSERITEKVSVPLG